MCLKCLLMFFVFIEELVTFIIFAALFLESLYKLLNW